MVALRKMRKTTVWILLCIAMLCGLGIAKFTYPLSFQWVLAILALLPLVIIPKTRIVYILVLVFIVGWWRGGLLQTEYQFMASYFNKEVTVTGTALEDGYYSYNGQLETVLEVKTVDGVATKGTITLRGYSAPSIARYDSIEATGKLRGTRGGKQGVMAYADISVTAKASSTIEKIRKSFITSMQNTLPEPAASLGIGILVGQRNLLPDDVAIAMQVAGLTHIIAVSGYNLTIIINAVRRGSKRLSKFQVVFVSASLIYLFLLVTGFSPSIVRASIVAGLGLAAWYYGRSFRPTLLILFTAAITAFYNPFYLWGDIGWYLSFLAFAGVLILAPLLIRAFARKELPLLPTVAIESFSAQLLTLPLIMFVFGKVSVVGFFANVLIVPLVPLAMLLSVVVGIVGMIAPMLAAWIALPARMLLNSMIRTATWFADWPHASTLVTVSLSSMLVMYGLIMLWMVGLKKRSQSVIIAEE